jgi:hypothetical protein
LTGKRKVTKKDAGAVGLLIFTATTLIQVYALGGMDEPTKYFVTTMVLLLDLFAYFQFYKT